MAKLIYCTSNSFISEREIESLLYFLSYHHQFVYYLTPSAVTFLTLHKYKYDICHYLIGKHILLSLIFSVSFLQQALASTIVTATEPERCEHVSWYAEGISSRVFCLKPSTLQQWKVGGNTSNLLGSLLWDVQYTVHSAHLYNLHWIKINVFPFTLSTFSFHLHFCESIWHLVLCTKDIKYFRC